MTGLPAVEELGGGQLLLRGPALVSALRLVEVGLRVASSRDGIAAPAPFLALVAAMRREVAELSSPSARGHVDVRDGGGGASSALIEPVTMAEVAQVLGVTDRQARRLAPGLGGVKVGGSWLVEASALAARAAAERVAG